MNIELKTYVAGAIEYGLAPDQIRQALLDVGWDTAEVERALRGFRRPVNARKDVPTRGIWKEAVIAALLSVPLLGLSLLAGDGFYSHFWWQLAGVALIGALADSLYCLTLRRLLTPAMHPNRVHLRWLIAGPPLALLLLWVFHISLVAGAGIALALGILAAAVMGGSLVWDALASSVGFGGLYTLLFLILGIPVTGPVQTITSFSGITLLGRPVEELLLVFLFGALWGPICAAFRLPPASSDPAFRPHHQLLKRFTVFLFAVALGVGTYWMYDLFIRLPVAVAASPVNGTQLNDLLSPIVVTFDRPIDPKQLAVAISPPVAGDVSYADPYVQRNFVRQLIVTPQSHLQPDTTYTVRLTHLTNVLGRQSGTYTLVFHTPALPTVAHISLSDGQANVGICDPITETLDQDATSLADFTFQLNPAAPLQMTPDSRKRTYTLTPTGCLSQNTAYTLTAYRRLTVYAANGSLLNSSDQPVAVHTTSFTTKGAPGISGFSPQGGGVLAGTGQLTLTFSEAMAASDPSGYLSISPAVPGSWKWTDDQTLTYTLSAALQLDTKYTVTVAQGLKDARSGFLPQDASYTFTTEGHVEVSSISPRSGGSGVTVGTPIKVTFDQPVDQTSAQQAFSISPAAAGTFSWQGQTMTYSAALSKDSSYKVTEAAGVVSLIGLPSVSGASSSFQTEQSVLLLSIPVYYQQKPLSCEAASLHMALAYKGADISEATILSEIGDDLTPRQGNIWGDPNLAFVGDVNGQEDTTGYGVYSGPIARVAGQYVSAQALSGMGVTQVAADLANGNPVIFWGTAGNARPDSWVTPSGNPISAWIGEHVRLIVGFTGKASHPTGFIINDPIYGRLEWTAGQLQANWGAFGGMGVAIL